MRQTKRKSTAKYTIHPRQIDRIYNGNIDEYEDPADYVTMRQKGRVIA